MSKASKRYAQKEAGEYFENEHTRKRFPGAFKNKKDFVHHVTKGRVKEVGSYKGHENTDAEDVKDIKGAKKAFLKYKSGSFESKKHAGEYFDKLHNKIASGKKVPPSIVGVHHDRKSGQKTHYLLAGNTRAMIHRALGKKVPTVHVQLKGPKSEDSIRERMNVLLESFSD